ncbi:MAG: hypothetical protein WC297_01090 [Candidatus Paceibacterota bacterium]|jgi:hypothetical protein
MTNTIAALKFELVECRSSSSTKLGETSDTYGNFSDDFTPFLLLGAQDILDEIGPISKEDYDYYENL